ncbi:carbohydrate ABC transporter permease [[Acholeplasma] multilocale]|uniref:carbohydrate ABC transporter permease n=1 Tax=[Acholeplasma] multilocale TaxID=264638 RepID=UPI00047A9D45|nr:sugar ABC transporter permease [[Acholeplasma] multilocale]
MEKTSGFKLRVDKITKKFKHDKPKNMEKGKYDFINQLLWITPGIFFIFLFTYYAIFIVFRNGFSAGEMWEQFEMTFDNFKVIFKEQEFLISIKNSFIYAIFAIPLSLLVALLTAKLLSNILNKRAFSFMQSIFFMPYITSAIAVAMAFSMIFSNYDTSILNQIMQKLGFDSINWRDPKYSKMLIVLYGTWSMLPFKILMFTSAFMKVNPKLYQAASIDGTPEWQQFWKISIPQIMPIIIYMVTTGIIGAFKFMPFGLYPDYATAVNSEAQTIVFYIFNAIKAPNYGKGGAAAIALMGFIMIMTILNRQLTKYLNRKYR